MADTKLILGDFEFEGFEVPESIPFGGGQSLATHRLPGGARKVQSLGRDDAPIAWSGMFFGPAALARSKYVDGLRVAGRELNLVYLDFNYQVVIERFEATVRKFNRIPYSISLLVVQDNTKPVKTIAPAGFDAALRGDMAAALALGTQVGDSKLSELLAILDSAIAAVSDFAKATTATIAGVVGPVGAVLARVDVLLGSAGSVLTSVTTLGGILPGNPIAVQAANALSSVVAATQMPLLVQLRSVANRMVGNLGAVTSAPQGLTKTVTVAGGTLFDVAAQQYGDATKWPAIAQANGLVDPLITGVMTLKIPTIAPSSGGVVST